MQRCYQGEHARLLIDPHGALWLDYPQLEDVPQPVPFVYDAGRHAVVLPFQAVQDLGPAAYGQFALDAAAQGIAVMSEVPPRAWAAWLVEQHEEGARE